MKGKKTIQVFFLAYMVHFVLQLFSYVSADGIPSVRESLMAKLWPIFSFPVFPAIPGDWFIGTLGDAMFVLFFVNSLVWAFVFLVLKRYINKTLKNANRT